MDRLSTVKVQYYKHSLGPPAASLIKFLLFVLWAPSFFHLSSQTELVIFPKALLSWMASPLKCLRAIPDSCLFHRLWIHHQFLLLKASRYLSDLSPLLHSHCCGFKFHLKHCDSLLLTLPAPTVSMSTLVPTLWANLCSARIIFLKYKPYLFMSLSDFPLPEE